MSYRDIEIGEFTPFADDVEAAILAGIAVDRCTGILGTRPPFRDKDEANQIYIEDQREAQLMASSVSGAWDLSRDIGDLKRNIQLVIISKSGALALRSTREYIEPSVFHLAQFLDDGNRYLAINTYPAATIG